MDGKQLKNSILQWAIQGKLVPQNPKDEPASKLLERITAARNESTLSLPKGAKSKKSAPTSRIYRENGVWYEQIGNAEPKDISEDIPFDIPENWVWCRFGNLVFNRDSERIPLSVEQRMGLKKIYDYYGASGVIDKVDSFLFDKPLLLIGEDGANLINRSTPIAFIARGQYWVNNHAHVIDCINEDLMQYVCTYINAISLVDYVTGTTQPKMNQEKMNSIFVAVPPLAEQKRIVAKLEQVLPLADEYGAAQEQLDKLNKELPEALKKSVLQQAIQGKLVPQNPKDEPAQKLLERITAARSEGSQPKGAKSKKSAPTSRIYCENGTWYEQIGNAEPKDITDEIPFDIPTSWVWCRLGNFVKINGGFAFKSENYVEQGKGIRVVRISDFNEFGFVNKRAVYHPFDNSLAAFRLAENDILMCMTGGTVGKSMYVRSLPEEMLVNQRVADISVLGEIESEYVYQIICSNYIQDIILHSKNSTNDNISMELIKSFLIPLPPLAEQKRIVTKLDQLFKVL